MFADLRCTLNDVIADTVQLITVDPPKVHVYRPEGNTDEQAEALKEIFMDEAWVKEHNMRFVIVGITVWRHGITEVRLRQIDGDGDGDGDIGIQPASTNEAAFAAIDLYMTPDAAEDPTYGVVAASGSSQANAAVYAAPTEGDGQGQGHAATELCARPSPPGGTCKNACGAGSEFCTAHTCPQCSSSSKSSAKKGCPGHPTGLPSGPTKGVAIYEGFGAPDNNEEEC